MIRYAILGIIVVLAVGFTAPTLRAQGEHIFGTLTQKTPTGYNDPGTPLGGKAAPGFTLTDQFGHQQSLASFHGKIVVLSFIDSRCTDTCPLTAQMLQMMTKRLGAQASQVQLLAVNANPVATSIQDVRQWSDEHGMTNRWLFLTGPASDLKPIWKSYAVSSEVEANGDVTHTPAVYLIDRSGREQYLFLMDNNTQNLSDYANRLAEHISTLLKA